MIPRAVEILKGKTTTLMLSVTGYEGRDLLVRVDMADVFQPVIKGKRKRYKLVTDLQEIGILGQERHRIGMKSGTFFEPTEN